MNAKILDSSSSPTSRDVIAAEPIRPSSPPARSWRFALPVSLGVLLLLASLTVAALSLRSHAGPSSPSSPPVAAPSDQWRWNSLGYVDIEGGVTPLYPVQPGRVKSIEAKENEPVKAGTPLFHLEDTEPALKVRQAKAAVDAAQAQLKIAQSQADVLDKQIIAQQEVVETAKIEVKRASSLREKQMKFKGDGIGGKFEATDAEHLLEKAKMGVRVEQSKLAALKALKGKVDGGVAMAHADVNGKQALLAEAENAVNECVVRAPVDGTPLRILVRVGETLGSNPRQPAVQFKAERPLLVRAEVEQEFVGHVRKDQSVRIEDNVTGLECATGKVVSIARWYAPHRNSASPEMMAMNNEVRTLECIVQIESTSREIRIGQRVRVQFPE